MHHKSQFRNSVVWIIAWAAAVALLVLLAVSTVRAQNPVPPTAREAAASPAFAFKLHPATPTEMNKARVAARGRGTPKQRQSPSCPEGSSPDCGGPGVVYENGPVNGTTDAWTINFGYTVSDSFVPSGSPVQGFDVYVWEFPGDTLSSLQWSITSGENSGTVYGSGTVSGSNLTDSFVSTNQYGYNIDKISASGLNVAVNSGSSYWVNVFNAAVPSGDPVFWDENSGIGCRSTGCPSQASESAAGTIPSEAFDIVGNGQPPPPPCFGAGGALQVLYSFFNKVGFPISSSSPNGLTADKEGNLYGTTTYDGDGAYSLGTAYELSPKGQGWVFKSLYEFQDNPAEGWWPSAVIIGPDGALYGAATGGLGDCFYVGYGYYCGLVFSLRPGPHACLGSSCSWTDNAVYQFTSDTDGGPTGNQVFDQAGNLYGTSNDGRHFGGVVYELSPSNGGWTEKIIYHFTGGTDGGVPTSLLLGNDGNLYGTTVFGGTYGDGAVFQLVPLADNWTENVIYSFTGGSDGYYPNALVQDAFGNFYGVTDGTVFMLSPSGGAWVFSVIYQSSTGLSSSYPATDAAGNVYIAISSNNEGSPGAVMMRPPGGEFSNLWSSGSGVQFSPGGPLAFDSSGNVYGTTSDCGAVGDGTIWELTH